MTRIVMLSRAGRESLPTDLLHDLEREHDLTVLQRRDAPTLHETIRILADADVLATTNVTLPPLTPMMLARLPRLREVVLYATGYEHVDLPLLRSHGVSLTTLPEYATRAVAEHALALLLSQTTRLHLANDKARGLAPDDVSLRGTELHSSTVAVVGVGRIGSEVARLLQALGVSVIGVDPDPARTAHGPPQRHPGRPAGAGAERGRPRCGLCLDYPRSATGPRRACSLLAPSWGLRVQHRPTGPREP